MSSTQVDGLTGGAPGARPAPGAPAPRVRHQAQDALRLMAFSAAMSLSAAVAFTLLTSLGR
ncbi:hypothetical protein NOK12_07000 [Nocardioides sp. OK12]|uniref:Uncharacterized protein n=1 Tax=Nocardioides marinisabuli TaxID=419476 RepID=A0A7Y9F2N7_9ACTN|nr:MULTISPECIES: hypothetical protein [Nocardioides]NYD58512.1 hypothetical protein [Nocardioides marinisabuli]GHJ58181.1 hypothetical protein NOK12_07000 [Nocardioides sp. OK12]